MTSIHWAGARVVSGSSDGSVREWDVIGGLPIPTTQGKISAVAFSRDGRTIASAGSDGTIQLWNPDTAKPARQLGDPATKARGGHQPGLQSRWHADRLQAHKMGQCACGT